MDRLVTWACVLVVSAAALGQRLPVDGDALLREAAEVAAAEFFDPEMRGVDWAEAEERFASVAADARTRAEAGEAINSMLALLETSHTHFYHQEEPRFYELLDVFSQFPGRGRELTRAIFDADTVKMPSIGAVTEVVDGRTFVVDVLHGSTGDAGGLLVGDEILSVDREAFHPIYSLLGKAGTPVRVEIQRTRDTESRQELWIDVELIVPHEAFERDLRESVRVVEIGQARVGYVRVYSFASEQYYMALRSVLRSEPLSKADALVFDLRGGWGGAQPQYLHVFSKRVPRLSFKSRSGDWSDVGTGSERSGVEPVWTRPVVMLVDGGSRSGKEILAHGFKTYGVGPLVGERTAGAVVGGSLYPLSNGDVVYVAVSDVRVDGMRLEGVGVTPDIEVAFDRRYAAGRDSQFEAAAALAAGMAFGQAPADD